MKRQILISLVRPFQSPLVWIREEFKFSKVRFDLSFQNHFDFGHKILIFQTRL